MYTARKRVVVKNRTRFIIFILIAIAIVNLILFAFIAPAKTDASISHKIENVCVNAGDTLWELANTYRDENTDVREMVYKIKKINNLKSADLSAGQMIAIPID